MPTKPLVALLLLLSIPASGHRSGQPRPKPVQKPRTQIAGLTTNRQVRQFLEQWDKGLILPRVQPSTCAKCRAYLLPSAANAWLKADFDGNGRLDILVAGYPGEHTAQNALVCFLDMGKPRPQVLEVLTHEYGCAVPQLIEVKNGPAVHYTHQVLEGGRFGQDAKLVCRVDTLVVRNKQLIEYNRAPKDYQIQQVAFRTEACYGSCPVFELRLGRDGTATYQAEEYNERQGRFTATVAPTQVSYLWRLLNYLDFPQLRDFYNVSSTDQPTCILTITYANGQVKTIADYGEEGTLGLRQVYKLLFELRTTQKWK